VGRISVDVSDADKAAIERLCQRLEGISRAAIARILLHYGIAHSVDAVAEAIREPGN
jgi:hypothetical protein